MRCKRWNEKLIILLLIFLGQWSEDVWDFPWFDTTVTVNYSFKTKGKKMFHD